MPFSCSKEQREYDKFVECEGETAVRVVLCGESNTGSGSGGLRCIKDVINLQPDTPLILTFNSIASICSVEFEDTNGNRIYLSYDIVGNQLTVCSKQELNNVLYRVIGE